LLLGTSFSLWRAVFLIRLYHDEKKEHTEAVDFLRELIETNAIAFTQDKKYAAWTAGYHINNAALRLHATTSPRETKHCLSPTQST
jgi:hypothetical protein